MTETSVDVETLILKVRINATNRRRLSIDQLEGMLSDVKALLRHGAYAETVGVPPQPSVLQRVTQGPDPKSNPRIRRHNEAIKGPDDADRELFRWSSSAVRLYDIRRISYNSPLEIWFAVGGSVGAVAGLAGSVLLASRAAHKVLSVWEHVSDAREKHYKVHGARAEAEGYRLQADVTRLVRQQVEEARKAEAKRQKVELAQQPPKYVEDNIASTVKALFAADDISIESD